MWARLTNFWGSLKAQTVVDHPQTIIPDGVIETFPLNSVRFLRSTSLSTYALSGLWNGSSWTLCCNSRVQSFLCWCLSSSLKFLFCCSRALDFGFPSYNYVLGKFCNSLVTVLSKFVDCDSDFSFLKPTVVR